MSVSYHNHRSYHRTLQWAWGLWLGFRLVLMTVVATVVVPTATLVGAFFWQLLVVAPLLFCTPFIVRAKNAYALIVISLLVMVYWGAAASFLLIKMYEKAPVLVIIAYGAETMVIGVVFVLLFMLTKKLPAMHKKR